MISVHTIRRRLLKLYRETAIEQKSHGKRYGKCLSDCPALNKLRVLMEIFQLLEMRFPDER